jgi:hypothetical protein
MTSAIVVVEVLARPPRNVIPPTPFVATLIVDAPDPTTLSTTLWNESSELELFVIGRLEALARTAILWAASGAVLKLKYTEPASGPSVIPPLPILRSKVPVDVPEFFVMEDAPDVFTVSELTERAAPSE